jgi:uncharacterized integral membrane protein
MMQDGGGGVRPNAGHQEGGDVRGHEDMGDDRDPGGKDWVERREGPSPKLIVAAVLGVVIVFFVAQNGDRTHIQFLFLDGMYPLWTLLVVGAALGFVAGWLVSAARGRHRRDRARKDD